MDNVRAEALNQPIFVVGPLRSGTSLLRLLIGGHSQINCFGEFEGAVSEAKGDEWPILEEYYEFLVNDRQTSNYQFNVDKSLKYECLVRSFLGQLYDRKPSRFIGSSVHSRIDLLPKLWPNAKFIHLLRDPRDVARSCIGMGWVGNVYYGANYWLEPERHWDSLCSMTEPSNRLTVKYEDLVCHPEEKLSEICQFLGLDFEAEMLAVDENSTYSRPNAKYAEQWKSKLSPEEVRWVECVCAGKMEERGYTLASDPLKPLTSFEKLKLWIDNRTYRVRFNIGRYGFYLWFMYVTSKKIGLKWAKSKYQKRVNKINAQHLK